MSKLLSVLALTLALSTSAGATPTQFYVSQNSGADAFGHGTYGAPFKSISYAIANARGGSSPVEPGDTVYVMNGTYSENFDGDVRYGTYIPSGLPAFPVTICAYPGQMPVIEPAPPPIINGQVDYASEYRPFTLECGQQYIVISGLAINGINEAYDAIKMTTAGGYMSGQTPPPTWNANPATHITIENCVIFNAAQQGIEMSDGADYNQVINCDISICGKNPSQGTSIPGLIASQCHGMYISTASNLIQGNVCHTNPGYGIQLYDGHKNHAVHDNVVCGNVCFRNGSAGGGGGMEISSGANNVVYNNVIYCNYGFYGMKVGQPASADNTDEDYVATSFLIANNTVCYNASGGIWIDWTCSGTLENNISYMNNPPNSEIYVPTVPDPIPPGDVAGVLTQASNLPGSSQSETDPSFPNETNQGHDSNFELTATSTNAIGKGTSPASHPELARIKTDILGVPRPCNAPYCIGAYEYGWNLVGNVNLFPFPANSPAPMPSQELIWSTPASVPAGSNVPPGWAEGSFVSGISTAGSWGSLTTTASPGAQAVGIADNLLGSGDQALITWNPTSGAVAYTDLCNVGFYDNFWGTLVSGTASGWKAIGIVTDLTGNFANDLIWWNPTSSPAGGPQVTCFELAPDGTFDGNWGYVVQAAPVGWIPIAVVPNLTGNGCFDLIWWYPSTQAVTYYEMTAQTLTSTGTGFPLFDGTWGVIAPASALPASWSVIGAAPNLTGNGLYDLIWSNLSTQEVTWFELTSQPNNYGNGPQLWDLNWGDVAPANPGLTNWQAIGVASNQSDNGHYDLIWWNPTIGAVTGFELGPPQGSQLWDGKTWSTMVQNPQLGSAGWRPVGVAADLIGDRLNDLVWFNPSSGQGGTPQATYYEMSNAGTPDGVSGSIGNGPVQGTPIGVLSGLTTSGVDDLVWWTSSNNQITVFFGELNASAGGFTTQGVVVQTSAFYPWTPVGVVTNPANGQMFLIGGRQYISNGQNLVDVLYFLLNSGRPSTGGQMYDGVHSGGVIVGVAASWHLAAVAEASDKYPANFGNLVPDLVWQDATSDSTAGLVLYFDVLFAGDGHPYCNGASVAGQWDYLNMVGPAGLPPVLNPNGQFPTLARWPHSIQ